MKFTTASRLLTATSVALTAVGNAADDSLIGSKKKNETIPDDEKSSGLVSSSALMMTVPSACHYIQHPPHEHQQHRMLKHLNRRRHHLLHPAVQWIVLWPLLYSARPLRVSVVIRYSHLIRLVQLEVRLKC
jgi:hypothetical protein